MSIEKKLALQNVTVRDLVANVTEDMQPSRVSQQNFSAHLDMSLAEKLLSLDASDHQTDVEKREDGLPISIEGDCLMQVQVVFDFVVNVNVKDAERPEPIATCMCLYDITYKVKEQIDEIDEFKAHIENTAFLAAWPYFRDLARVTFMNMGFQVPPPLPVDPFAS